MMIDCYHLFSSQKTATGRPILNDVSFQIEAGEFVALLGLNGAGKSSLLKSLLGLLPLKRGEIRIQNELMNTNNLNKIRRCLAMIFQGGGLIRQLSALDNVLCGFLGSRSSWQTLWGFNDRDRVLALDLLTDLGLKEQATQKVSKLSGGQQQRVAIARALINQPSLLLADEPTGALDSQTTQEVMNLFDQLHQQQIAIVLITHDLAIADHTQRKIQIRDGLIVD